MEWFVGWEERQIWRGEGGEEWANMNGQMVTESREMYGPGLQLRARP